MTRISPNRVSVVAVGRLKSPLAERAIAQIVCLKTASPGGVWRRFGEGDSDGAGRTVRRSRETEEADTQNECGVNDDGIDDDEDSPSRDLRGRDGEVQLGCCGEGDGPEGEPEEGITIYIWWWGEAGWEMGGKASHG
ncbi:hypothetical protein QJS10_CPB11g01423 [Acorus calamus]|uniref:Uncharacterized protein n=1 Tax=Acorus calamus TaxID=4465 RepID=A0AAV9DVK1_ACOCL|nr:hypothetical protein QJS10_CPB11g01423 [Acorus calamus]